MPAHPLGSEEGTRIQDPGDWNNTILPGTAAAPQVALPNQITLVLTQTNAPYVLAGKTEYLIGREDAENNIFPDLDLSLSGGEEAGVSRKHARIFYRNNAYWIEDQDSLNYTFLNGVRLKPRTPYRLNDGDDIAFASLSMRFHIGAQNAAFNDWRRP